MIKNYNIVSNLIIFAILTIPTLIPGHIRIAVGWSISFSLYALFSSFASYYNLRNPKRSTRLLTALGFLFLPIYTLIDNGSFWYPYLMPSYLTIGVTCAFIPSFVMRRYTVVAGFNIMLAVFMLFFFSNQVENFIFKNTINPQNYSDLRNNYNPITYSEYNIFAKENLNDKIVVVDFWYTSCAPCIAKHSSFDSLADAFSHRGDIVFLSVVDGKLDSRDKLDKFLTSHPIKTKVLYDSTGSFVDKFSLRRAGYPLELRISKKQYIWEVLNGFTGDGQKYIDQGVKSINYQINRN